MSASGGGRPSGRILGERAIPGIGGSGGGGDSGGGGQGFGGGGGGGDGAIERRLFNTAVLTAETLQLRLDADAFVVVRQLIRQAAPQIQLRPLFEQDRALDAAAVRLVALLVAAKSDAARPRAPLMDVQPWRRVLSAPTVLTGHDLEQFVVKLCPGFWPFC